MRDLDLGHPGVSKRRPSPTGSAFQEANIPGRSGRAEGLGGAKSMATSGSPAALP